MHDERTLAPTEAESETDRTILSALLDSGMLWSFDEVAREIDDPNRATDSLNRLHSRGLIHRRDGFVWTTRAARHASRLAF